MRAATLEKISLETSMLQRAQGPGVVKLMDCFEDDDNAFLVTELLAGGDLQQYSEVRRLARPCSRGLHRGQGHHAHGM